MTSLARCVGDPQGFLDHQWSRAPLHLPEADESAFADLFSLDDVDHIVASTSPRLPSFRLVRDGKPLDTSRYTRTVRLGGRSVTGVADPRRVFEEFDGGATLVIQGLHRYWPALTRFCRDLELELTHPVQANAYITPARSRGLAVHYDTHDVFVLQLSGTKSWQIHEPVLPDPLPSQPWSSKRRASAPNALSQGEPLLAVDLRAGDCLYVPRGFLHSASAQEEVSAHLTIGVHPRTWHDVVTTVVAGTADEAWFRTGLPAGHAHNVDALAADIEGLVKQLRAWLDTVDSHAVAQSVTKSFWQARPAILAGQLRQLSTLDHLDDHSRVRRRVSSVCHIAEEAERLSVVLGDRELHMPRALGPVMRRLAGRDSAPFTLADLHELDRPSRLVLGRRLVREGFLEVVEV